MHIQTRTACAGDAEQLLEIYTPYVLNTAITFEYEPPTLNEFKNRITDTLESYPYIIAEYDGKIVGYAYASVFKGRKAYDRSVETSIYVRQDIHGHGIGRLLYSELERLLVRQNVTNVNACIAYTQTEDEYLSNGSTEFHKHIGYSLVGTFHKCAYKFNTWYDMIWMEKMIGEHKPFPEQFIPFSSLSEQ